jgi:hypothetical protein
LGAASVTTVRQEKAAGDLGLLPHGYVSQHVELAYATTTARAPGRTVETAHVLVDDTLTREALYVAASRARNGSHLYVATEHHLELAAERPPQPNPRSPLRLPPHPGSPSSRDHRNRGPSKHQVAGPAPASVDTPIHHPDAAGDPCTAVCQRPSGIAL